MDDLRTIHLGAVPKAGRRSVLEQLDEAYRNALAG